MADEKVKQAIAVVVEPGARRAEWNRFFPLEELLLRHIWQIDRSTDAGRFGHVFKPFAFDVVEQVVLADTGDENVGPAVVVVVADANTHAVDRHVEPDLLGHIFELEIAEVAIELERWLWIARLCLSRPRF